VAWRGSIASLPEWLVLRVEGQRPDLDYTVVDAEGSIYAAC
jgi:hypothetical protein